MPLLGCGGTELKKKKNRDKIPSSSSDNDQGKGESDNDDELNDAMCRSGNFRHKARAKE